MELSRFDRVSFALQQGLPFLTLVVRQNEKCEPEGRSPVASQSNHHPFCTIVTVSGKCAPELELIEQVTVEENLRDP